MTQLVLSLPERGILFILMAQGRPIKQADFKKVHGLDLKKHHRQKLSSLELIDVATTPGITLSLTKKGWAWIAQELSAPKPKGSMGLGPLYAMLKAVDRLARLLNLSLEEALTQNATGGEDYIQEAAWADADESLACALQDIPAFALAMDKLKNAVNGAASLELRRAEQTAKLVFQSVRQAAARRELDLCEPPGTEVSFNPTLFDSDDPLREGERVRIRKPAILRGHGAQQVIIKQGLVEAIDPGK